MASLTRKIKRSKGYQEHAWKVRDKMLASRYVRTFLAVIFFWLWIGSLFFVGLDSNPGNDWAISVIAFSPVVYLIFYIAGALAGDDIFDEDD